MIKKIINLFKKKNKEKSLSLPVSIADKSFRIEEFKLNTETEEDISLDVTNSYKRMNNLLKNELVLMYSYKSFILSVEKIVPENITLVSISDHSKEIDPIYLDHTSSDFQKVIEKLIKKAKRNNDEVVRRWFQRNMPIAMVFFSE